MISSDDNLKSFQRTGYCVGFSLGIFSAIIINFEDNISQYIKPIDACRNQILHEIIIWISPRIAHHCDLISIKQHQNIYPTIGVIWDFWIFMVCISSLLFGFCFFLAMHKRRKSEVYEFVEKHRIFFIFVFSVSILVLSGLLYYVFFSFPLVDGKIPLSWKLIKEDRYGIHAAVAGSTISIASFKILSRSMFIFIAILNCKK